MPMVCAIHMQYMPVAFVCALFSHSFGQSVSRFVWAHFYIPLHLRTIISHLQCENFYFDCNFLNEAPANCFAVHKHKRRARSNATCKQLLWPILQCVWKYIFSYFIVFFFHLLCTFAFLQYGLMSMCVSVIGYRNHESMIEMYLKIEKQKPNDTHTLMRIVHHAKMRPCPAFK